MTPPQDSRRPPFAPAEPLPGAAGWLVRLPPALDDAARLLTAAEAQVERRARTWRGLLANPAALVDPRPPAAEVALVPYVELALAAVGRRLASAPAGAGGPSFEQALAELERELAAPLRVETWRGERLLARSRLEPPAGLRTDWSTSGEPAWATCHLRVLALVARSAAVRADAAAATLAAARLWARSRSITVARAADLVWSAVDELCRAVEVLPTSLA